MDKFVGGRVLLLGEGDFSFSVSLVSKLSPEEAKYVTATSFETSTTIKKHLSAEENMSHLREKGVMVLLETDATQLHHNPNFRNNRFDRIIFNFPHAGGKSNHKKNRKLIKDFFCSAAFLLQADGQILMSLCKGQGGTPADKPMRAWYDSWQVVSMAAYGGLMLKEVIPFVLEDFDEYTSTGFRSQNKGFNTEGALTHIFVRGQPVEIPQYDTDSSSDTDNKTSYIYRTLQRKFYERNDNPLFWVRKKIENAVEEEFGTENLSVESYQPLLEGPFTQIGFNSKSIKKLRTVCDVMDISDQLKNLNQSETVDGIFEKEDTSSFIGCLYFNQPIKYYGVSCSKDEFRLNTASLLQTENNLNARTSEKETDFKNETFDITMETNVVDQENSARNLTSINVAEIENDIHVDSSNVTCIEKHLRVSLLEHVDTIIKMTKEENKCCLLTGDVYRCCSINESTLPARHEMLGVVNMPCGFTSNSTNDVTDINPCGEPLTEAVDASMIKKSNSEMVKKIFTCLNKVGGDKMKFCYQKELSITRYNHFTKLGFICVKSQEPAKVKVRNKPEPFIAIFECNSNKSDLEDKKLYKPNNSEFQPDHSDFRNTSEIKVSEQDTCTSSGNEFSQNNEGLEQDGENRQADELVNEEENQENQQVNSGDNFVRDEELTSSLLVDKNGNKIVGYIWSVTSCIDSKPSTSVIFLLDLDTVTMDMFKIPQIRLLWTNECKIFEEITKSSVKYPTYKAVSLYPMLFKHDMSFWENPKIEFNELEYYNIIRDVAGDTVTSVYMIDTYRNDQTGLTSRCYRLEFQSCDHVLSYDTSWKLQSIIRLEVAKKLEITLR